MNSQIPKISIVLPNYNHSDFLPERMDSILGQTFSDFELIILDDCSTDNSEEILKEYAQHPKVSHLVFNKMNSGSTFRQWNKGIALAKGDLIWIAESDDYADPQFLEKCIAVLAADNKISVVYCQSNTIDEHGKITGDLNWWTDDLSDHKWKNNFTQSGDQFCASYMSIKNGVMNASSAVFRKSAYINAGGANEHMKLCGDWEMWTKIIAQGNVSFIAESLNYYRFHSNTVRSKKDNSGTIFKESLSVRIYCWKNFMVSPETKDISAFHSMRNMKSYLMSKGRWNAMVLLPVVLINVFLKYVPIGLRISVALLSGKK